MWQLLVIRQHSKQRRIPRQIWSTSSADPVRHSREFGSALLRTTTVRPETIKNDDTTSRSLSVIGNHEALYHRHCPQQEQTGCTLNSRTTTLNTSSLLGSHQAPLSSPLTMPEPMADKALLMLTLAQSLKQPQRVLQGASAESEVTTVWEEEEASPHHHHHDDTVSLPQSTATPLSSPLPVASRLASPSVAVKTDEQKPLTENVDDGSSVTAAPPPLSLDQGGSQGLVVLEHPKPRSSRYLKWTDEGIATDSFGTSAIVEPVAREDNFSLLKTGDGLPAERVETAEPFFSGSLGGESDLKIDTDGKESGFSQENTVAASMEIPLERSDEKARVPMAQSPKASSWTSFKASSSYSYSPPISTTSTLLNPRTAGTGAPPTRRANPPDGHGALPFQANPSASPEACSIESSPKSFSTQLPVAEPIDRVSTEQEQQHQQQEQQLEQQQEQQQQQLAPADHEGENAIEKLQSSLLAALQNRNLNQANIIFTRAKVEGAAGHFDKEMIKNLYYLALNKRSTFTARSVLQYYATRVDMKDTEAEEEYYHLYKLLCNAVKHVEVKKNKGWEIEALARSILAEVLQFPKGEAKERCLRQLLSAFLAQKMVILGKMARDIYEYMKREGMEFSAGFTEHILSFSRYQRQDDLPFAELLLSAVTRESRPIPANVANLVENMFPHQNMDDMRMVMTALVKLQSLESDDGKPYILDMAVLESIAASASRAGNAEVMHLIWEYLEKSEMNPSIGIYESTAVSFARSVEQVGNAFAVFEEMQARGLQPSRALVRNMVHFMNRSHRNQFDSFLEYVMEEIEGWISATRDQNDENGPPFPLTGLNFALCTLANKGDLYRMVQVMNLVGEAKLPADSNTFSFAFETMGKHVGNARRNYRDDRELSSYVVGKTVEFLDMMNERQIPLSHFILRDYVEVLCAVDDVDTATHVLLDALTRGLLCNKSIYRVAVCNAERGNFATARDLADRGSEELTFLHERIRSIERRRSQSSN